MGKLYSSLIFRSIVNGGSNLSIFHSSSSNSVATHMNALIEKGCALDIRSHNIIINGYCKAKRLDKAMELFDEITQNGPIPNTVAYNTLMQSMCQLGRVSTAFELLVKMCASGQVSNLVTCSILLDGLCKSGKLEEALKLFRAMRTVGISSKQLYFKGNPTSYRNGE
ncbi:pentatricopeptide repeat-containing protein [Gossypium australe]|uniref:Pentatricopeptide repeat-containing protein n=1 Tax=Gossypium australe TaxID=47621 RepID=A0A5B6VI24_9ROSI|nr:pentatricopeptide repeat-containing protein [Gossypium australe]